MANKLWVTCPECECDFEMFNSETGTTCPNCGWIEGGDNNDDGV